MIEQYATVISTSAGYAWVSTKQESHCQSCAKTGACSMLSLFKKSQPLQMQVLNVVYARVGDEVVVGLKGNALLLYAVFAYLLPLLSLFVFSVLGMEIFYTLALNTDLGAFLFGMAGLLVGLRVARHLAENERYFHDLQPVILRKDVRSQPIVALDKSKRNVFI